MTSLTPVVDNTVNTIVNSAVTKAINNADGNNPVVSSFLGQIIVLIDNAVDDLVNNLIAKVESTTTSAVSAVEAKFSIPKVKASIRSFKSLRVTAPTVTPVSPVAAVNNLVDSGVDSLLNTVATDSNNSILAGLIASLEATINNIINTDIDPIINSLVQKFSAKNAFKINYRKKINSKLDDKKGSLKLSLTSLKGTIDNIESDVVSIANTAVNFVDVTVDHLVDTIVAKLRAKKLLGSKFKDASINAAANTIVDNAISNGANTIMNNLNVSSTTQSSISSIISSLEGCINNILDSMINGLIAKFSSLTNISATTAATSTTTTTALSSKITEKFSPVQIECLSDLIVGTLVNSLKKAAANAENTIKTDASSVESKIGSIASSVESKVGSIASSVESKIESAVSSVESDVKNAIATVEGLWDKYKLKRPKYNLKITRNDKDKRYKLNVINGPKLPSKFSLRPKMGPVWTQGDLGSCTAFASTKVYQYHSPNFSPSQLFQYQQELIIDGDAYEDNGSTLSTAFASLRRNGVCSAQTWPYDPSKFSTPPPTIAINEALLNRDLADGVVGQSLNELKTCLADPAHQNPIAFGVMLFESFESENTLSTGIVPMPNYKKEQLLGGHAIVITGYDDEKKLFEICNSWGPKIGDGGYFYFPYQYILNSMLTSDFHTLYKVSAVNNSDIVPSSSSSVSSNTATPNLSLTSGLGGGMYKLGTNICKAPSDGDIVPSDKAPIVPKIHSSNISRPKYAAIKQEIKRN